MGNMEKISAWNQTKVRSKSGVIDEARTKGAKVHFASLTDICHLKILNWRQSTKSTKVGLYSEVVSSKGSCSRFAAPAKRAVGLP